MCATPELNTLRPKGEVEQSAGVATCRVQADLRSRPHAALRCRLKSSIARATGAYTRTTSCKASPTLRPSVASQQRPRTLARLSRTPPCSQPTPQTASRADLARGHLSSRHTQCGANSSCARSGGVLSGRRRLDFWSHNVAEDSLPPLARLHAHLACPHHRTRVRHELAPTPLAAYFRRTTGGGSNRERSPASAAVACGATCCCSL